VSGIVALFHLDGRPAEGAMLQKLADTLSHRGPDGGKMWLHGSAGLACQHLRVTPESTGELQPPGCPLGLAISFDGRLDNRDELLGMLRSQLEDLADPSDSAIVLAAYRRFGEGFAEYLNGDFAVAIFDDERQTLLLARDIMGIRPLYYWQSQHIFLAASEIKAILAHPEVRATPDDDALADFIFGGDAYDVHLTCFRNVYRVQPGHTIVVQRGEVRLFQHWDFTPAKQVRYSSLAEYAEALRALFKQAVRRRLRSAYPVAVTVSGGLDSSAILCQAEMLRQAAAPVAPAMGVSMIFPDGTFADEKQYLDHIEAARKLQIRKLAFSRFHFNEDLLWHTEVPRLQWDSTFDLLSAAKDMGCRLVLDGYYGDQMMDSDAYMLDLARSFRWVDFNRQLTALARSMKDADPRALRRYYWRAALRDTIPAPLLPTARRLRRIFGSEHYPRWYSKSFQERAFERSLARHRPNSHFGTTQSETCYQFVAAAFCLNVVEEQNKLSAAQGLGKAYPFMDRDLIQFMMTIPGEFVNWQGASKGLFREAMRGILPEAIRRRDWKADFTLLVSNATAGDYERFQQYLQPDCLAVKSGYLDPIGLLRDFPKHRGNLTGKTRQPSQWVTSAVALELWLRLFFSESS
jgi:asparagine synthase (glutamine-hydrolysing)